LEFALAGSRQDAKKAEAKCACRLGLFVNLNADAVDAGVARQRRPGLQQLGGQGKAVVRR
jgi:hypothetical protein